MAKTYIKKKEGTKLGYRTSDYFKGKTFGSNTKTPKFNPSHFKKQHKG